MKVEKKSKKIYALQTEKQPSLDFPMKKKINTLEHYLKYCKRKEAIHINMLVKPIQLENVGSELVEEVDDFIIKLLLCGVAVYCKKVMSTKYLLKV